MAIHVEVITQEGLLFEENEADMVIVPGSEGEMGVLPHHAPVLTTMGYGELRVKKGNAEEDFMIYGGVVDIRPGHVIALADMAESSYAANVAEAERARAREGGVSDMVRHMFARSAALSDSLVTQYKEFWQVDAFPYTDTGQPSFHEPAPAGFYYPQSGSRPRPA